MIVAVGGLIALWPSGATVRVKVPAPARETAAPVPAGAGD
jgi:hypothetical protein